MSEVDIVFAAGRAVERIVVVAAATLAIWCGYRLFEKVVSSDAELVAQGKGFKFRLLRVGPGVFFALFGCAVLAWSVASPVMLKDARGERQLSATQGEPAKAAEVEPAHRTTERSWATGGTGRTEVSKTRDLIFHINTVHYLVTNFGGPPTLNDAQKQALSFAMVALLGERDRAIESLYAPGALTEYRQIAAEVRKIPGYLDTLPADTQKRFNDIKELTEAHGG